jgi:hypothetical protein
VNAMDGAFVFYVNHSNNKTTIHAAFCAYIPKKPPSIQFYGSQKNRGRTGNFPTLVT